MISAHQNRELGATIGMGIADLRHTPPNRITTRLRGGGGFRGQERAATAAGRVRLRGLHVSADGNPWTRATTGLGVRFIGHSAPRS
jgi:hypothetical protein